MLARLGDGDPFTSAAAAFAALAAEVEDYSGLSYEKIGLSGAVSAAWISSGEGGVVSWVADWPAAFEGRKARIAKRGVSRSRIMGALRGVD